MQEVFEKIKEKIRKEIEDVIVKDTYTKGKNAGLRKAEVFVDEVAAEYNNGWIPCSSGVMPRANGWYLVTNHLGVVQEQRWSANHWEKLRDDAVLAWRELPAPYQPNICTNNDCTFNVGKDCPAAEGCPGYERKQTNADRIRSMNDEELAEFIEQISTDSMDTISFGTKDYEEIWEHKETALKWLQSEVEVDNFD